MHRLIQRRLAAAAVLTLLGLLTACGNDSSSSPGDATSAHNEADVAFATNMIPHHAQAIEMAKMAVTQATSKDIVDLATEIQAAQQPEIDTMTGWLESWGESTPDTGMAGMDHGDMEDGDMSGMMTSEEMQHLAMATGPEFDRLWLQLMTRHHEGAVDMATTELRDGQNVDAKTLAQDIIDGQQAEITRMKQLLHIIAR